MNLRDYAKKIFPFHKHARGLEMELMRKYSEFTKTDLILDAGCGDGTFFSECFGTGLMVVGVDISNNQLLKADKLLWVTKLADLKSLPFEDSIFDAVVSNSVLEHVDGVERAIEELSRVSKKGARMLLTLPTDSDGLLVRRLTKVLWNVQNNFSLKKWRAILSRNGFKIKNVERYQSYAIHLFYIICCIFIPVLLTSPVGLRLLANLPNKGVHLFLECEKI